MSVAKACGKNLTGELFDPRYLISEGGIRPVSKGAPNGLESTENRRSAGRDGNQHVCVRRPQVIGSDRFSFSAGEPPGLTRSRSRNRVSGPGSLRGILTSPAVLQV